MITIMQIDSAFGQIQIRRSRTTGSLIYWQGGCRQSEAGADGISLTSYVHALFSLLLQSEARNILMIGCGGGTLATMLHRAGAEVTVVDVNPSAFEISRACFSMPDAVSCVVKDGYDFLAGQETTYDAIVLDAYDGGTIPPQFEDIAFAGLVRARLQMARGIFLTNVHVNDDLDTNADSWVHRLSLHFPEVRLLDERGSLNRNTIVMAGAVEGLELPRLTMPPRLDDAVLADCLARLSFRPAVPKGRVRVRPKDTFNTEEPCA